MELKPDVSLSERSGRAVAGLLHGTLEAEATAASPFPSPSMKSDLSLAPYVQTVDPPVLVFPHFFFGLIS